MSAEKSTAPATASDAAVSQKKDDLVDATLYRLTNGLPRREMNIMVQEFTDCESMMDEDIKILEMALLEDEKQLTEEQVAAVKIMLESPLTALDRFWTGSALLGRMRNDRMLPASPNALIPRQIPKSNADEQATLHHLLAMEDRISKLYHEQPIPSPTLLTIWKKISSCKAAAVFRKPVRNDEAPGYSDRIVFPMDLSLVRKRIQANNITTLASLHAAIGLISHNCVKYNGRESDYGQIARDFEAAAESCLVQALRQAAAAPPPKPAPKPAPTATPSQTPAATKQTTPPS